ncbi:hypothetical protein Tco_0502978 [Tanacetum coccineum]
MEETMEQYMSKTPTDYGSRVSRPKIEEKDSFELKGQFFKEFEKTHLAVRIMRMRTNTLRKFSKLSLDPLNGDYIELNDLNKPFKLRRNQGDDLMPTVEEGKVIEEFRTRDEDLDTGIDDYPSYYDDDKKIHIDHMDAYRDKGMGDVIVGEPFLREFRIKARQFNRMITIYNGDDEVTYQMVRSHPRFKYHTNEQCNKIPPLQKESEKDEINGISHAYQKLKGFYKGVLNLRPDYIRSYAKRRKIGLNGGAGT